MSYTLNQDIEVQDRKDGKKYPAKVVQVDNENKEVKIHFVDWHTRFDEVLPFNSDRIFIPLALDQSGNVETTSNSQDSNDVSGGLMERLAQETIGNLLRQAGPNPKMVISAFHEKEDKLKNEKALSKFLVPMLEETAEFLKIDILDHEGKKIFVKNSLTKTIVRKLSALLPSNCSECQEIYSLTLGEEALFNCMKCSRQSHGCEKIANLKAALPNNMPLGFCWLCLPCMQELKPEMVAPQFEKTVNDAVDEQEHQPVTTQVTIATDDRTLNQNHQSDVPKPKICQLYKKGACPHGCTGTKLIQGETCKLKPSSTIQSDEMMGGVGYHEEFMLLTLPTKF